MPGATLEHELDGRTQRRAQSLERAVDAVLDLIASGVPAPTAQQIAAKSGISIRTVFRLTEDVESLLAAAVQRQTERVASFYVEVPVVGSLDDRVRALVKSRAAMFEVIAPVRRVGGQLALRSPHVAKGLERQHRVLRAQVATLFANELGVLGVAAAKDALNAAEVVAGWETWDQLRRGQGLSVADASRLVRLLLLCSVSPHD